MVPFLALALCASIAFGAGPRGKAVNGLERLLYVTNKSGLSVYDINDSHKLLRQIAVPDTGVYKGISASVPLGHLHLTSNLKDDVVAVDLATDAIVWRKSYAGQYPDSQAISPDGKTLYVPMRAGDSWYVLDAATGNEKGRIQVEHGKPYEADNHPIGGVGPHNTWMNRDGTRVYFEVLTMPWIYVADTKTNKVIEKVGPFSKGIRPFAVSEDEKYIYANVDWLLGFEVATGGKMVYRVEAHTPASRLAQIAKPPPTQPSRPQAAQHSQPRHQYPP